MRSQRMSLLAVVSPVLAVVLSLGWAGQTSGAIVTPNPTYALDFDDVADVADFAGYSQGSPGMNTWTVAGGTWTHAFVSNGGGSSVAGQNVQTSGVVGQNFTVSTDFTLTARNSFVDTIIGVTALSSSTIGLFDSSSWYQAAIRLSSAPNDDRLDVVQNDGGYGASATGAGNGHALGFTIATGTLYHLSLSGTYDGSGNLILATTLTDTNTPTNTLTVTTASIASPKTGAHFGYNEVGFFGSGATIQYDNFNLSLSAVPEPMSPALACLGSLALLRRRRGS